jgi:hypothetical protein
VPSYATSDLSVTKVALNPVVLEGEPVHYRITVHNNGPDTDAHAVLVDKPGGKGQDRLGPYQWKVRRRCVV